MTVSDASLDESGSNFAIVAATSLLLGVTRTSSEAYGLAVGMISAGAGYSVVTTASAHHSAVTARECLLIFCLAILVMPLAMNSCQGSSGCSQRE